MRRSCRCERERDAEKDKEKEGERDSMCERQDKIIHIQSKIKLED